MIVVIVDLHVIILESYRRLLLLRVFLYMLARRMRDDLGCGVALNLVLLLEDLSRFTHLRLVEGVTLQDPIRGALWLARLFCLGLIHSPVGAIWEVLLVRLDIGRISGGLSLGQFALAVFGFDDLRPVSQVSLLGVG
jgi:hypothetical protein